MSARLFLAILATSALAVALVGVTTRLNFERGFLGYLNELATERMALAKPRLETAYLQHGNWDFLHDNLNAWHQLLRPAPDDDLSAQSVTSSILTSDLTGAMLRMSLLDRQNQWVAGFPSTGQKVLQLPLRAEGETVGWLTMAPFQSVADGGDQRFQQGQAKTTVAIAILALVLSALIAWWVARTLLTPVRRVAAATHRLAAGHHDIRVPVDSQDEVGQLARDFNHLALTLGRNEKLRRNFMADVSHELRTPLGILKGELEALEDGIVPLNAEAVMSLQAEVARIGGLVEDLHELALSDAGALSYRKEPLDLVSLLQRATQAQQPRLLSAGLTLNVSLVPPIAMVTGDAVRLLQLLDNLLENCRRYTDAPGIVQVTLEGSVSEWQLAIEDSAPGVPSDMQDQLFDRFFRIDGSRSRATGGSGLGLPICSNIVQAHGGHISARASALGGVCIAIALPREASPT
ncbi:MAG: Signal transduction histidine-protein kinase BaeS [Candidatus Accumulibacter appositus]|uniref:histidine kinase n=1 Tax=Candidatus Accumulibacter appositus TaxID=1454003 RepID=A0A011ND04_9PROT|nr:ATP-binding protein [Accumulibacter sp.]EXI80543.1 MAG: Signal transduction histidine-protein kinase BaeS [Candidatus Accumulibacter appositus]HRF03671.1 ATP-binding protein [Accumulibacter sp.]